MNLAAITMFTRKGREIITLEDRFVKQLKDRLLLRPDRLRAARVKRGLSQRELGRLCELGINQITRYELGISEPGSTILTTIAQQLGVSTDYLVGLSDDPHDYAEMPLRDDERELLEAYASGNSITLMRLIADRLEKLAKSPDGDET